MKEMLFLVAFYSTGSEGAFLSDVLAIFRSISPYFLLEILIQTADPPSWHRRNHSALRPNRWAPSHVSKPFLLMTCHSGAYRVSKFVSSFFP